MVVICRRTLVHLSFGFDGLDPIDAGGAEGMKVGEVVVILVRSGALEAETRKNRLKRFVTSMIR